MNKQIVYVIIVLAIFGGVYYLFSDTGYEIEVESDGKWSGMVRQDVGDKTITDMIRGNGNKKFSIEGKVTYVTVQLDISILGSNAGATYVNLRILQNGRVIFEDRGSSVTYKRSIQTIT